MNVLHEKNPFLKSKRGKKQLWNILGVGNVEVGHGSFCECR